MGRQRCRRSARPGGLPFSAQGRSPIPWLNAPYSSSPLAKDILLPNIPTAVQCGMVAVKGSDPTHTNIMLLAVGSLLVRDFFETFAGACCSFLGLRLGPHDRCLFKRTWSHII